MESQNRDFRSFSLGIDKQYSIILCYIVNLFEDRLAKYDASITLNWIISDLSYDSKLVAFYRNYNISKEKKYKDMTKECLKKQKGYVGNTCLV